MFITARRIRGGYPGVWCVITGTAQGSFTKSGLVPDQRLLDFGGAIPPSLLRRLVKSCEYLVNLFVLGIRLTVSPPDILHVEYLPFLERKMPFELWFFLQWMRHRGIRVVYTLHRC